jgi:hypothetical protein
MKITAVLLAFLGGLLSHNNAGTEALFFEGLRGRCRKIVALKLVAAPSGRLIADLKNGTVIYLNDTTPAMTVMAVPDKKHGHIKKVQMDWNGKKPYHFETTAPYTLCGGSPYGACVDLKAGKHTVTATVFKSGKPYTVTFELKAGKAPGPPTAPVKPPASPTAAPVAPVAPVKPPASPTGAPVAPVAPVKQPASPTGAPVAPMAPVVAPSAPIVAPSVPVAPSAPVAPMAPPKAPTVPDPAPKAPTKAPVAPTEAPTGAPTEPPTKRPTKRPTKTPTKSPIKTPTMAPVRPPYKLLIASGNRTYTDSMGRVWGPDVEYTSDGHENGPVRNAIDGTIEDGLYQTERWGEFEYKIPVPYEGRYKITLHFAEI